MKSMFAVIKRVTLLLGEAYIPACCCVSSLVASNCNSFDIGIAGFEVHDSSVARGLTIESQILDVICCISHTSQILMTVPICFISWDGIRDQGIVLTSKVLVGEEQHPASSISRVITVHIIAIGWIPVWTYLKDTRCRGYASGQNSIIIDGLTRCRTVPTGSRAWCLTGC